MKMFNAIYVILSLISSAAETTAEKISIHEIEEKSSQLNSRSFNPLSSVKGVGSDRISFRGNSSSVADDIFVSQDDNSIVEATTVTNNALSIGITDDEDNETSVKRKDQISPFLSATLRTTLSPISTSSLSSFDNSKQSAFSDAYIAFLEHVLENQEVYDVKVLSVSIFDKEMLSLDGDIEERGGRKRDLLTNGLQFSFNDDYTYDDDYDDDDNEDAATGDVQLEQSQDIDDADDNELGYKSLQFGIVLTAEHTLEPSEDRFMSNDQFGKIILHVSDKFHSHLLDYVKDSDLYYRNVDRVDVVSYAGDGGFTDSEIEKLGIFEQMENRIRSVEQGTLNTWSIVAIVLGGVAFVGLLLATVKLYKRDRILKENRWRSQEIASSNANASPVKSLRVLYGKQPFENIDDDYSFDPLGTDVVQNIQPENQQYNRLSAKEQIQRIYRGYTDIPLNNTNRADEENAASEWPKVAPEAPAPLFPGAPPVSNANLPYSLDDERLEPKNLLYNLPRQHVYALPGKVGVAIDIQDGQPVVHKVKKGSPLEGLLQPQDIIVAIDDVSTNCMSAADVTHLMVKRMNYRRKITFVRRG